MFLQSQSLFTYGSLMCEGIMTDVTGLHLSNTPAVLPVYRRYLVQDEQYPGLIAVPEGQVAGRVYHGLTALAWKRLDQFEGEMYGRMPVTVRYADDREDNVDCYVVRPAFIHRLTATDWDYEAFVRTGKALFQQQYCGFRAIK